MDRLEKRFELIAPLLRRYKRRFTVLDLGAGINPYLAQRISNEFDCVYVAVEQDEIYPMELAKLGPRALWLRRKMSVDDLQRLACCEHFDVVLAMNFLHHFGPDWVKIGESIRRMSDYAIIQTPYAKDDQTCGQAITPEIAGFLAKNTKCLGESVQFDGHMPRPVFLWQGNYFSKLSMSSWTSPEDCIDAHIRSCFEGKTIELRHKQAQQSFFIHGLNLWNFAQLGGAYPSKERVLELIREFDLPSYQHGDITPHNFLFDGQQLHLIDGYEGWKFNDKENLLKTEQMMAEALQ